MRGKCTNIRTSNNVPVSTFLPSLPSCKLITESSNNEHNALKSPSSNPVVIKHSLVTCIEQVSYGYDPDFLTHVHSAALTENGKRINVFEQDKEMSLKVHSYTIDDKGKLTGTSTMRNRNTWLIRDYDYFISDDHTSCVLFNCEEKAHHRDHRRRRKRGYDSGGTIFISLCKFDLDYDALKSRSYDFYPNLYMFALDNNRELDGFVCFWKFLHNFALSRKNLVCIVSQGHLKTARNEFVATPPDNTSNTLMLLDFLQIESEPHYHINHLFQRDLSKQFSHLCLEKHDDPAIVFNVTGSKILFVNYRCVYSIADGTLVLVKSQKLSDPYWLTNVANVEMIVNISQTLFGETTDVNVELLKPLKRGNGDYELFHKFSVMEDILHCQNGLLYCHAVSNGCAKLFVEVKGLNRRIIIVEPICKQISAVLEIPERLFRVDIVNILVNRNEVVVVFREEYSDQEILVIYNLPNQKVYPLKYLASQATLSYFSFNQLQHCNLPRFIIPYLENF